MKTFLKLVLSVFIFFVVTLFAFSTVSRSLSHDVTVLAPSKGLNPGDTWPSWLMCQSDFGRYPGSSGFFCYFYRESENFFISSTDGSTISHSSILNPTVTLGDLEIMWGMPDRATYNQWWTQVFWSGFKTAYTESINPESKVHLVSFDLSDRYVYGDKWRGHVRAK